MRAKTIGTLVTCAILLVATTLAAAAEPSFEHVSAEVDGRYKQIFESCIDASFETRTCRYNASETPLMREPVGPGLAVINSDLLLPAARGIRETAWAASLLVDPHQPRYWTERQIGLNFEALERLAVDKARRENLKPCQRACLATCISSQVISYDHHLGWPKTTYGAVETEHGVCREFASVARDLMWRLGVHAELAFGLFQDYNSDSGRYKTVGAHAMTAVILDGHKYLMEPQHNACMFYNPRFSRKPRPNTGVTPLENTGQSPALEPAQPAHVASDWRKWLDVTGWVSRGGHAIQERIIRAAD